MGMTVLPPVGRKRHARGGIQMQFQEIPMHLKSSNPGFSARTVTGLVAISILALAFGWTYIMVEPLMDDVVYRASLSAEHALGTAE